MQLGEFQAVSEHKEAEPNDVIKKLDLERKSVSIREVLL